MAQAKYHEVQANLKNNWKDGDDNLLDSEVKVGGGPEMRSRQWDSWDGAQDAESGGDVEVGFRLGHKDTANSHAYNLLGDEDDYIQAGRYEETDFYGVDYNANGGTFQAGLEGERSFAVLAGKADSKTMRGALEGKVEGEVLAAKVKGQLGIEKSEDFTGARAALGGEAVLASAKGEGVVNIIGKTVYENIIGRAVGWFDPKSDWAEADDMWDHEIVAGQGARSASAPRRAPKDTLARSTVPGASEDKPRRGPGPWPPSSSSWGSNDAFSRSLPERRRRDIGLRL